MRNLPTLLLALACAGLMVLGILRFVGTERPLPAGDAAASANAASQPGLDGSGAEIGADEAESGSRALVGAEIAPQVGGTEASLEDEDAGATAGNPDAQRAALLARVEERFRRQAEYTAKALGLVDADEQRLFEVLLGEYERREQFFAEMRKDAFDPEMRARVREELMGIQEWKTQELQAQLGAELAQAVQDFEQQNDRGQFDRSFERDGKERSEN